MRIPTIQEADSVVRPLIARMTRDHVVQTHEQVAVQIAAIAMQAAVSWVARNTNGAYAGADAGTTDP